MPVVTVYAFELERPLEKAHAVLEELPRTVLRAVLTLKPVVAAFVEKRKFPLLTKMALFFSAPFVLKVI